MRAALILALFAVSVAAYGQPAEPLTVYTVNYPLGYFATRIGGERIRVEFPAPVDGDPAYWTPNDEVVEAYRRADLVLLNGAGYARWVPDAMLPADKLVHTSAAFSDRLISDAAMTMHSHDGGAEHSHGADESGETTIAFTTWLDPRLAIAQASAIRDALSLRDPGAAQAFAAGFAALKADLEALDSDLEALFAELGDTPVVFSHPVYQYLQRRYSVNGISVHWEPDQAPGDDAMIALSSKMIRHPAEIMFWESKPLMETADLLETWDVDSVVLDPCGNRPTDGDYLVVMQANVANLRAALAD